MFFVEDDYLHFESALEEMISTYERISSQINKDKPDIIIIFGPDGNHEPNEILQFQDFHHEGGAQ